MVRYFSTPRLTWDLIGHSIRIPNRDTADLSSYEDVFESVSKSGFNPLIGKSPLSVPLPKGDSWDVIEIRRRHKTPVRAALAICTAVRISRVTWDWQVEERLHATAGSIPHLI